jgi:hypothetical protein
MARSSASDVGVWTKPLMAAAGLPRPRKNIAPGIDPHHRRWREVSVGVVHRTLAGAKDA